jgi:hypothetical protein
MVRHQLQCSAHNHLVVYLGDPQPHWALVPLIKCGAQCLLMGLISGLNASYKPLSPGTVPSVNDSGKYMHSKQNTKEKILL